MRLGLSLRVIALLFAAPVVVYVVWLLSAAAAVAWKTGWGSRPLVFMGLSTILVFMSFAGAGAIASMAMWCSTRDRFIAVTALVAAFFAGTFWVGLLTRTIGILLER